MELMELPALSDRMGKWILTSRIMITFLTISTELESTRQAILI